MISIFYNISILIQGFSIDKCQLRARAWFWGGEGVVVYANQAMGETWYAYETMGVVKYADETGALPNMQMRLWDGPKCR